MWQVSEATIKRWADAGHLQTQKTIGGHRRFTLAEVLRFESAQGLGAPSLETHAPLKTSETTATRTHAREQFFAAIVNGHEAEAAAILLKLHLERMPPVRILEEVVTPSLYRIGDLWHGDELSVADEHLATRTAIRAIETLRTSLRATVMDGPVAICCAVEDELHDVATLCVQVLLESAGWSVRNLGANTPFFALGEAIKRHRPRLVCISSTTNIALSRYAREYAQFQAVAHEHGARIALGGAGFEDETIQQRFSADLHATTLKQLSELMKEGLSAA